jgi:hypothetical protein
VELLVISSATTAERLSESGTAMLLRGQRLQRETRSSAGMRMPKSCGRSRFSALRNIVTWKGGRGLLVVCMYVYACVCVWGGGRTVLAVKKKER